MVGFFPLWMGALLHVCQPTTYTNDWAITIRGDLESVDRIAKKYGFTNMGQIGLLEGFYSFRYGDSANRSTVCNQEVTDHVAKETKVEWIQQQVVLRRVMRSVRSRQIYSSDGTSGQRLFTHHQFRSRRIQPLLFSDPLLNGLWNNHCSNQTTLCQTPMNIGRAWRRGYTGKGVVVSVLADGIERRHPDIKLNYDPIASYDVNGRDRQDPSPNYSNQIVKQSHGTQCARLVAAPVNVSKCTAGVSFHARIGGIRMLDGDVTDMIEAQSLNYRPQHIDIYLAGWGPEDNGLTLEGPGFLTGLALQNGVQKGRRGRGSVYVWPSGNGGRRGDHCSCDGYSSSIYTISISSGSLRGVPPDYVERCSSTLAASYSGVETEEVVTLGAQTGTSLSSSVAAGVIALALEANPLLTWRDVQHLIVQTSKAHHLVAPDWHVNGAGYKVSHVYGFGLLDAEAMVKEAQRWKRVASHHACVEEADIQPSRIIHPGSALTSVHWTTGCAGEASQHVAYAEHVVVTVTLTHSRRGDLSITLESPSGTVSQLLANRPLDSSTEGFQDWEFMTTHCWGEKAAGKWTLTIQDTSSHKRDGNEPGLLNKWSLVIYGTSELPHPRHRKRARSAETLMDSDLTEEYSGPCDPECSDDGCEGPSPQQCVTCLHFFLKFKNNTRVCVAACPKGFWGDRRRCKRCYSSCESCTGSRSDQCTSCQPGHHLTEDINTCTTTCEESYYLDHDVNMCRKCSENCLKCTSYNICTECKPDTSLYGNQCQQSCDPGSYHASLEGTCKACDQACATCAGAGLESCIHCAEGFLMEEWHCVSYCSNGFYATEANSKMADGHSMCRRCDASCLTCAGPGWGNCSSCSSGHSLQGGVCVVSSACTDGEYHDNNGECHTCDATCLKCTGPGNQDCISCASSRVLDEGRCVEACNVGKYPSGGQCHLCDHTCATCVDSGPASCASCDTDKFGLERYLFEGRCVEACPAAFYHTKQRSCESCMQHCLLCTSLQHCLQCSHSYHLSDGQCTKLECGEGEVEDPDYNDCMACEEGCKNCVLYNPRHCLSCIEGFYNFQDACYRNCPAMSYSVEDGMTCLPCEENCVSCDEHECYWCEADYFLSDGNCVTECPPGFYVNEDTNDCEECHSDCETCSGPEDKDCLSCADGKTLVSDECVSDHEACPVKSFRGDDGACEDCHPSCEFCSGEEKNQCTKCAKGRFLTTQQTCVSKCPVGFLANRLSGVCEACPPGCVQCVDTERCSRCLNTRSSQMFLQDGQCVEECRRGFPAGQVCVSCAPGCASCRRNSSHCLSCDEPLLLHKHQCVDECPPAHTVRDQECQHCPSACEECDLLGQCTECEEYHFLLDGLCAPHCPESFYEDTERGECLRCHPDCALCDGPSSKDCNACADPEATQHDGQCLAGCPRHTYRETVSQHCKDCHASCLTCLGPHVGSCTSCREDLRLDSHNHCLPLSSACSPHQYEDQDGECHACHKYCHRCSGPGKNHCLSCNQRHFLLNGTCVDECPAGYYEEKEEEEEATVQKCEPCHDSCQSCIGRHSHECLTCRAHLFREGKECVETCKHSHYGNAASRMCERCDPSCGECIGGGEEACLSCVPGLIYLRKEGRCLPSCPHSHYHDTVHRMCEPCHHSCRSCSGTASTFCDSCYPGFLLSDGRCESMCDVGQHPVPKGSGHSCEDCDGSCLECRGPGPSNCTTCPAGAILENEGRCLPCCRQEDDDASVHQDCCNCTKTRGECILSTNLAFRNEEVEAARGNLTIFIIACVLLVLALVAVVFLVRHSRSKSRPSDLPPRGYEKLGSGGGRHGYSSASSASHSTSSGNHLREAQLVDFNERHPGKKDDEDDDEDEDIVYMGKDGTVYRKFRYGQLGDDNEDELEYDDESYAFR